MDSFHFTNHFLYKVCNMGNVMQAVRSNSNTKATQRHPMDWPHPLHTSLVLLCLPVWHTSLYSLHSSHSIHMDVGSNHPIIIFSSNKCFKIINMNQTEMEQNKIAGREEETWSTITHGTFFYGPICTHKLTETFQDRVS